MLARLEPHKALLAQAADLIELQGLCKNRLEHNGAHCANGALNVVAKHEGPKNYRNYWYPYSGGEKGGSPEWRDAVLTLARMFGWGSDVVVALSSIAEWNNAPERTQAEVVAKFREAAFAPVTV